MLGPVCVCRGVVAFREGCRDSSRNRQDARAPRRVPPFGILLWPFPPPSVLLAQEASCDRKDCSLARLRPNFSCQG